jgi:protease I
MGDELKGKKVALLVTDGFEQAELTGPRKALDDAGAATVLVSPKKDSVRGMNHQAQGDTFPVDVALADARAEDYDALVLPGGVANPDALRMLPHALRFVSAFARQGKPIAAICHGPWTLIECNLVAGKRMTSWPSLKTDLTNAGARWVDEEVVVDGSLITSRKPDDIPAFNAALIATIRKPTPTPWIRDAADSGSRPTSDGAPRTR